MDVITQTLCGAVVSQAVFSKRLGRSAALFGGIGGVLADIDTYLPFNDHALAIDLHRHFTHALLFIPVGGLIAGLPLLLLRSHWRKNWKLALGASTLGYATHGLLDTCTSYGTHLLWPFTDARAALDLISIIDPLFTIPLLFFVLAAVITGGARAAIGGIVYALLYLSLCGVQHTRAAHVQETLAAQRGHEVERRRLVPSFGNQIIWRSLYLADGEYHADAVRVPWFGQPTVIRGATIEVLTVDDLPKPIRQSPEAMLIYERFSLFADGYLGSLPSDSLEASNGGAVSVNLWDLRYSGEAAGFAPLWGKRIVMRIPQPTAQWIDWDQERDRSADFRQLWRDMTVGDRFEVVQ